MPTVRRLGEVYRFLNGVQPNQSDFKSHRELFPDRKFNVPECEACGLSVYRSRNDLTSLIRRVPKMRGRLVARATLRAELGALKPTPKREEHSHCTWWIPLEVEPWTAFEVIDLTDGGPQS